MPRLDGLEEILLLGDPRLRENCRPVTDFDAPEFRNDARRLIRALEQFRREQGFGRAISGPQIGILRRMIAMNLGDGPVVLTNPELSGHSGGRFSLWDDCMSFPWLMVRLKRDFTLDVAFQNMRGDKERWPLVEQAVSELLQHEVDHLNGVLAIDHALDRDAIISRKVYEARKEYFDSQVDYSIKATLHIRGSGGGKAQS
jgi:peptide deformylase